ncbi:MAG: YbaB/EbfC family nucleoid-associated protein, partial [Coxiellaceae bacterium]|nr:YbaB/EbfC family nucleoid-associated protein [Coxiellaceae bacterium]
MFGDKFNLGGLGGLMKSAKKVQEMMEKAQEELAKIEVTGESGAGAVKVTVTAQHYAKRIDIDPEILKESKEVLEELIAAAINDATQKVETIS